MSDGILDALSDAGFRPPKYDPRPLPAPNVVVGQLNGIPYQVLPHLPPGTIRMLDRNNPARVRIEVDSTDTLNKLVDFANGKLKP